MGELLVVYDTTVMRGKGQDLEDPELVLIQKGRDVVGYRLAISEVSVRELLRQEENHLRKMWNRGSSQIFNYAKRIGLPASDIFEATRIDADVDARSKQLRTDIESFHDVLPIPVVTTEEALDRAIKLQQPFGKGTGKGYRDFLIWRSILEEKHRTGARIVFVTANSNYLWMNRGSLPAITARISGKWASRNMAFSLSKTQRHSLTTTCSRA